MVLKKSNFNDVMKYLILGRHGWLAEKFHQYFPDSEISQNDIFNLAAMRQEIEEKKPEIIINTAGATGRPHIDYCEDHKLETLVKNVALPLNVLNLCQEKNIYWVHLSSGCIFQGLHETGRGHKESDPGMPPSFYSETKYWTDQMLRYFPVLILRLRLPVDNEPHPRNLINKLAKYEKVIDNENSITIIPDLLKTAAILIERRRTGVYHVTNPGTISPSRIMELYQEIINPEHRFEKVSIEQIYQQGLAKAVRSNCILNTEKLTEEGIYLKNIQERIIEVLNEYKTKL